MKFVKLSIFALSMGLFVASCGDNTTTDETTTTDSTIMEAPMPEPAPVTTDTTTAMPVDSTGNNTSTDNTTNTPAQ